MLALPLSRQTTTIVWTKSQTSHHCATHQPLLRSFSPPTIYQPLLRLHLLHCLASPNCIAGTVTSQHVMLLFCWVC
ncbi:hypothetical protein ACB092_01G113300 [Castanea dentata]